MTTNKPEAATWDVADLDLHGDVMVVRLSDYEALHADHQRLQAESLEMVLILAESRANDRQTMHYLNQVREIVDGDDFPDMVERVAKLQAECEKLRKRARAAEREYSKVAQTLKGLERVAKVVSDNSDEICSENNLLRTECEKLRKDAEFGRSVLSKREPGKAYGCHCDLEEGMEPDGCVIDSRERHNCIHAKDISVKEQCSYWRVIATDADHHKQGA